MKHCLTLARAAALGLCAITGSACTTLFDSRPAAQATNGQGFRYWLPAPHIMLTPQADGSMKVDVIYLPDRTREYTIEATSVASRLDLVVTYDATNPSLLASVKLDSTTSGAVQTALNNASALRAAEINAGQAEERAAETIRQGHAATIATLTREIALLENEDRILAGRPQTDAVTTRRQAIELEVSNKRMMIDLLRPLAGPAVTPASIPLEGADDPEAESATFPEVYGPILFRVWPTSEVEHGVRRPGVELRAVETQLSVDAIGISSAPVAELNWFPRNIVHTTRVSGRPMFEFEVTLAVEPLNLNLLAGFVHGTQTQVLDRNTIAIQETAAKKFLVFLPANLAPGRYDIVIPMTPDGQTNEQRVLIEIEVEAPTANGG